MARIVGLSMALAPIPAQASPFAAMLREVGLIRFEGTIVSDQRKPGQSYSVLTIESPYLAAAMNSQGQSIQIPVDNETDDLIPKHANVEITVRVYDGQPGEA